MKQVNQSTEDYLEAILMIHETKGKCRSIDVANQLGYSKPSVSVAVAKLRTEGYLEDKAADGDLILTDAGREIAQNVLEKHKFFKDWLMHLGVSEQVATEDACGMEHWLSEESFHKMKDYITSSEMKDHGGVNPIED